MLVARGSIKKFCGIIGSTRTSTLSLFSTPTAVSPTSGWSCEAALSSTTSSNISSPIPVPNIAAFNKHSAIELRAFAKCMSSSSWFLMIAMSAELLSWKSSLISKNLPRPKVASSISATVDSTACCEAGETMRDRSDSLVLSSADHVPLNIR